jgi:hypothetical protein
MIEAHGSRGERAGGFRRPPSTASFSLAHGSSAVEAKPNCGDIAS